MEKPCAAIKIRIQSPKSEYYVKWRLLPYLQKLFSCFIIIIIILNKYIVYTIYIYTHIFLNKDYSNEYLKRFLGFALNCLTKHCNFLRELFFSNFQSLKFTFLQLKAILKILCYCSKSFNLLQQSIVYCVHILHNLRVDFGKLLVKLLQTLEYFTLIYTHNMLELDVVFCFDLNSCFGAISFCKRVKSCLLTVKVILKSLLGLFSKIML